MDVLFDPALDRVLHVDVLFFYLQPGPKPSLVLDSAFDLAKEDISFGFPPDLVIRVAEGAGKGSDLLDAGRTNQFINTIAAEFVQEL